MSEYRSSVQAGRWFFGFTLRRFSVFVAWKSRATWLNYGRAAGLLPNDATSATKNYEEPGGSTLDEASAAGLGR